MNVRMLALLAFACLPAAARPGAAADPAAAARRLLAEAGVQGGLVVHLGCGDARLTQALRAKDRYLVQGWDRDAEAVAKARERLLVEGVYGPVSVGVLRGSKLPYNDNLAALVIAERLDGISMAELIRVLRPLGVALVRTEAGWRKTVKPWPEDIDAWSHFLHDATNNAVASDRRVGPPRRLQWTCGPLWSRSHEFVSSLSAMVTAQGRLFYIFDEGLPSLTDPPIPARWTLTARDAFSGVLLWRRRLDRWGASGWKRQALRSTPPSAQRLLVAAGDRLFVPLSYGGPVCVLDAASGDVLETLEETDGAQELRWAEGVLLVRLPDRLLAFDGGSLKLTWSAAARIAPATLTVVGDAVAYQQRQTLVCVGLRDGAPRWRADGGQAASLIVACGDRLYLQGGRRVWAVAAADGRTLWSREAPISRRGELFVAQGRLWQWEGGRLVGRDLDTGRLAAPLATDDVFTPGHHLRCYQTKATERYLITPNRGAEFVSLTEAPSCQNDWVRGACRFGVVPANGLLYAAPHPCMCYPGVLLTGFNALASGKGLAELLEEAGGQRLERGPAYAEAAALSPDQLGSDAADWPTYRRCPSRWGAASCPAPETPAVAWRRPLGGDLTPPVAAGGRVLVGAKREQALYALDLEDGRVVWRAALGGPLDTPPTAAGPLVLAGCRDGWVYCFWAADGRLAWRFRAAPLDRRIVAFDRVESVWPVHGGVLLLDGLAYVVAGRSTYLDGGLWLYALDPRTGQVRHERRLDTWAPRRVDAADKPFIPGYVMEGAKADVLVSQGGSIYLGQYKLDRTLTPQPAPYILPDPRDQTTGMDLEGQPFTLPDADPKADYETHQRQWLERTQPELLKRLISRFGTYSLGQRAMGLHLSATHGLLDDSWFNRTYWMYAPFWPGYYIAHRASKTGQLLVVGPERTYAVQAFPSRNLQSPLFTPGEQGYLLVADRNDNDPVLDYRTRGTTKGWGYTRAAPPAWFVWAPLRIRAMTLAAGRRLYVAGPPDVVPEDDPMASFEGRLGGVLQVYAADTGRLLGQLRLDHPPVFDGLIAAQGSLLISDTGGGVVRLNDRAR